ncbi:hypothetical protein ACFFX1_26585 [Dactylosporangium sucinum]|uniref:PH domain-containing protein n=1 Tax=Dactylosporangium sucinum TaxID=1424081 RepID=A0A917WGT1_9ACTN|nr:hypothetical protein [Dactylosporangium sucinum]GGM05554.1 hypothetical protein GCM10007977_003350 [Dactylosporangium sucinum]
MVRLRRDRALLRTHGFVFALIALLVALAVTGIVFSGSYLSGGGPAWMDLGLKTLAWLWIVLAAVSLLVAAAVFALFVLPWLSGRTELTDRGIVLRWRDRAETLPWIDVAELRAIPASGGHLYAVRMETGTTPRRVGRGWVGGTKEAYLGWHEGADTPVAAVARPSLGIKYHGAAR